MAPIEEPKTQLTSPSSAIPSVQYAQFNIAGASSTVSLITATPLLCANTSPPIAGGVAVNTVFYSAKGAATAPTPLPFVFGANSVTPSVSAEAIGASQFNYGGGGFQFTEDGTGSLVCYGLDANGVRRITRDLFEDAFDGVTYNSTAKLSVLQIPGVNSVPLSAAYVYTIDVAIPPLPQNTDCSGSGLDCKFSLLEGYDTAVFNTNANGSGWCLDDASSPGYISTTTCPFNSAATAGNIQIDYRDFASTTSLAAPIQNAGGTVAPITHHFVVFRYLKSGVSSVPTAPVAIASLFSPSDLEENKLDDNVSAGNNTIANAAPSVATDATWATFSSQVSALAENTDSGTLTFNASDSDTQGAITASATLTLPGGVSVPLSPSCSSSVNGGGENATCSLDIALNNASFWDGVVGPGLAGSFNSVATDVANGTYASGVQANLSIIVTDASSNSSAPVIVPVHIHSTSNNPPVVNFAATLPNTIDANADNALVPTYTCAIGAGTCGAASHGQILVDLSAAMGAAPGIAAAFDEIASQTTSVTPFSDPNDQFTNVECDNEQAAGLFLPGGGPIVAPNATAGSYDMSFLLPAVAPAASVSTLCTVTVADQMTTPPFPNSEATQSTQARFRVVINP